MVVGFVFGLCGASEKLALILHTHPTIYREDEGGDKVTDLADYELALHNVTFRYPTKPDVIALKEVTLSVKGSGPRFIAMVGESGSGKSTVI